MKLFFKPGACSLASHILSKELELPVALDLIKNGQTSEGADFKQLTPKGAVPALQLDDGQVLTEGAVILQYLADQKPEAKLLPAPGSMERYRAMEWLNYLASEIHKGYSPLFNPKLAPEAKQVMRDALAGRMAYVDSQLAGRDFLGGSFSAPDAYLFTMLRWSARVELDLAPFANIQKFIERVKARPAVQAALKAEGLA